MATQVTRWLAHGREFNTQAEAEEFERRFALVQALGVLNRGQPQRIDMEELAKRMAKASGSDLSAIADALQAVRQS